MAEGPIRVVIADDHTLVRSGLRMLLEKEPDISVVGEAASGREAVRVVLQTRPDVLLLDWTMPDGDGLEVLRQLRVALPQLRILVLTMHENPSYLRTALTEGAAGYVVKDAADTDLLRALRSVAQGQTYVHPTLVASLLQPEPVSPSTPEVRLSQREEQVLRLVARGHTNREIAEQLSLSVKTIETYRLRGMQKLGLESRAELIQYALQQGWLDEDGDA